MAILTINSGSSSLKASFFAEDGSRRNFSYRRIGHDRFSNHAEAFDALLTNLGGESLRGVGHRFVHGGDVTDLARIVDQQEYQRLAEISDLAPLHMPANLLGVRLCETLFEVPQVACFDTAFHAGLPEISARLPIRDGFGLRRYGFHGLNYAHIARRLPSLIGDLAHGRVVVAHLGHGASLCLLENLQSVDTSMAYTPAGGVPMGTRSGDLDPGVMLELAKKMDLPTLQSEVFEHMGLLALSDGESSEMQQLIESHTSRAQFAVEYFCRQIRGTIGSFAAKSGGIDALVFTAGIGERSAVIREMICTPLAFLDFELAPEANRNHATMLSVSSSKPIMMIPADEEAIICDLTRLTLA